MKSENFDFIRTLVRQHSAILLEPGKEYLVSARLGPVARSAGIESVDALIERLRSHPDDHMRIRVAEALVTTETSFFRDVHPFEVLKGTVFPALMAKRSVTRSLRLWSAACSSGQEPYSVSMLLQEMTPLLCGWRVELIASDFSNEMIERAKTGEYTQLEINRGMPAHLLVRYFERNGLRWRVNNEIRTRVEFRQINLARPFPPLPRMDVILLRNVLIYFDEDTRRDLVARVARQLQPDGFLIVGAAETMIAHSELFKRVRVDQTSCYQLREPEERNHGG